ncbi:MAG: hypothetical protein H6R24_2292, partial [Proteobacteria bacterium]|nr:hypothetical protein [Pseudomonadota bacterium]
NLKDWLNEASQQGSGDDITVGILCQGLFAVREQPHEPQATPEAP